MENGAADLSRLPPARAVPARGATDVMEHRGAEPHRHWTWRVVAAVVAIVVLDQLTKSWVVARYSARPLSIIGDSVEFHVARNAGSAFGRFQGMTPVLAIGAVVVSVFLFRTVRRASDPWTVVALALVLGGALGNFADRVARDPGFLRGHVVDFVRVGSFPVFNLADSCITMGAVLLVVRSLFPPATAAAPDDATPEGDAVIGGDAVTDPGGPPGPTDA